MFVNRMLKKYISLENNGFVLLLVITSLSNWFLLHLLQLIHQKFTIKQHAIMFIILEG